MPTVSTEPAGDRRAAIITAATALFAQDGYRAVGMRAIADAVGIRASSLYHHFPSKVDLLYAVCVVATESFISAQLPELEAAGAPRERLARVLRAHVLYFHEHRLEETVGLRELEELRRQAPERHDEIQRTRRGYQHAIQAVIEEGVAAGEFRVPDPRLAALAVLGLVNSINGWFVPGGPATIEEVAGAYVAMTVDGLLTGRAPGPPEPRRTRGRGSRA